MRNLFRRFRKNRQVPREDVDLNALTPVVHLIENAEPDPQLFARIEASIDADLPAKTAMPCVFGAKVVLTALLIGLGAGGVAVGFLESRQTISAQPGLSAPWIPLGSANLRGAALRSFVRSKCEGQTHFFITMHGFDKKKPINNSTEAPNLMVDGEKILMECIF